MSSHPNGAGPALETAAVPGHRTLPAPARSGPPGACLAALLLGLLPGLSGGGLEAQAAPLALSLQEALDLAQQNNPGFLAAENDLGVADWDVRSAYGSLVPSLSLGGGLGWQGEGEPIVAGALTASQFGLSGQPAYYSSSYRANLNWSLSGQNLFAPSQARAARAATAARIDESRVALDAQITGAYLELLRQDEGLGLAEQQLERARFNLRLAQAQADVGTATLLDVRQAEVQVGRAEVAVLQADNARTIARLRLLQQMGVDVDREVEPTTRFELQPPDFSLDALLDQARTANPSLRSTRGQVDAARAGLRVARSSYFPSLSVSASLAGFAQEAADATFLINRAQASSLAQINQCQSLNELYTRLANPLPTQDCTQFAFTDAQRSAILANNDAFPFDFTNNPPTVSLQVTVPIFQGLGRQREVEAASAQQQDAQLRLRELELQLQADVAANLAQVETAYQSALIEERNRTLAEEQLRLARERYQVGAINFVDLVEAETVLAQADRDRIAAIYAYHDALTNLEAAVGRPLRSR